MKSVTKLSVFATCVSLLAMSAYAKPGDEDDTSSLPSSHMSRAHSSDDTTQSSGLSLGSLPVELHNTIFHHLPIKEALKAACGLGKEAYKYHLEPSELTRRLPQLSRKQLLALSKEREDMAPAVHKELLMVAFSDKDALPCLEGHSLEAVAKQKGWDEKGTLSYKALLKLYEEYAETIKNPHVWFNLGWLYYYRNEVVQNNGNTAAPYFRKAAEGFGKIYNKGVKKLNTQKPPMDSQAIKAGYKQLVAESYDDFNIHTIENLKQFATDTTQEYEGILKDFAHDPNVVAYLRVEAAYAMAYGEKKEETYLSIAQDPNVAADYRIKAANAIENGEKKEETLASIAMDSSVDDEQRLEAANAIENGEKKEETLASIGQDSSIHIHYRTEAANAIEDNEEKEKSYLSIAQDPSIDADYRLKAAKAMKYGEKKEKAQISIAQDPNVCSRKRYNIATWIQDNEEREKSYLSIAQDPSAEVCYRIIAAKLMKDGDEKKELLAGLRKIVEAMEGLEKSREKGHLLKLLQDD